MIFKFFNLIRHVCVVQLFFLKWQPPIKYPQLASFSHTVYYIYSQIFLFTIAITKTMSI
jgi:hypothetical protein